MEADRAEVAVLVEAFFDAGEGVGLGVVWLGREVLGGGRYGVEVEHGWEDAVGPGVTDAAFGGEFPVAAAGHARRAWVGMVTRLAQRAQMTKGLKWYSGSRWSCAGVHVGQGLPQTVQRDWSRLWRQRRVGMWGQYSPLFRSRQVLQFARVRNDTLSHFAMTLWCRDGVGRLTFFFFGERFGVMPTVFVSGQAVRCPACGRAGDVCGALTRVTVVSALSVPLVPHLIRRCRSCHASLLLLVEKAT